MKRWIDHNFFLFFAKREVTSMQNHSKCHYTKQIKAQIRYKMSFFKINITTQRVPVVSNGRQASKIDLLVFFQVQTSC